MAAAPEKGMYFRKHGSLQLRAISKAKLHCDPSAANVPGSCKNKCIDPEGRTSEAHPHYTGSSTILKLAFKPKSISWCSLLFSSQVNLVLFNSYVVFQRMMDNSLFNLSLLMAIQLVFNSLLLETILQVKWISSF